MSLFNGQLTVDITQSMQGYVMWLCHNIPMTILKTGHNDLRMLVFCVKCQLKLEALNFILHGEGLGG